MLPVSIMRNSSSTIDFYVIGSQSPIGLADIAIDKTSGAYTITPLT